ncbi:MAG: winged helix-turn-helix domain-containing protein, partial [Blastocatellia bacterium]
MVNAVRQLYSFEQFQLDVANRLLMRQGATVPLAPKVFDLLLLLVERRGDVLEKDELMQLLWPGTYVEENNLTVSMSALRKALGDGKDGVKFIETIPRRGYRFIAQVEAEQAAKVSSQSVASFSALQLAEPVTEAEILMPKSVLPNPGTALNIQTANRRKPLGVFLAVGGLLLIAAAVVFMWRDKLTFFSRAEIRSLAVLPFKPLVAGMGDESLGLGLADALITRLSNTGRIVVRPTSAIINYSKPDQDLKAAARELEVDALLDGRVQRLGDRIRITIQFLRAADGETIWGYSFDEQFTNILAVQNTISEKVANALTLKLTESDRQRLNKRYTDNPDAFEAYLKGRYFWNKRSPEAIGKAIEFFNQAIEFDPNYA